MYANLVFIIILNVWLAFTKLLSVQTETRTWDEAIALAKRFTAQMTLEEHVTGVVWSGLPGPEYGPVIVDVLYGNYNPGGRLFFTIAKNDSDYMVQILLIRTLRIIQKVFS